MISVGKFALGLVTFVTGLIVYLQKQKLIEQGYAQAIADTLRNQADLVARADVIRADASKRVRDLPEVPDDKFKRD